MKYTSSKRKEVICYLQYGGNMNLSFFITLLNWHREQRGEADRGIDMDNKIKERKRGERQTGVWKSICGRELDMLLNLLCSSGLITF